MHLDPTQNSPGILISNYFVILTHDENQIAAFTIIETLSAPIYELGEAFSAIMRTRMNILIGKKLPEQAKTFSRFYYQMMLVMSLLLGITLLLCRGLFKEWLASSNPQLAELFSILVVLLVIYEATGFFWICSVCVAVKTIGQIDSLVLSNMVIAVGINLAACIVGRVFFDASCIYVYHVSGILCLAICGFYLVKILTYDWSLLQTDDAQERKDRSTQIL